MPITFHTADITFKAPNQAALKQFIKVKINELQSNQTIKLSFIFCSDEYLLTINKKFLNHDYYTDIITFPLTNTKELLEAEIYISVERVKENAPLNPLKGTLAVEAPFRGFGGELHRVIFHGVLHLLGFKDKTRTQKTAMRKAEDQWLREFQIITIKTNKNTKKDN